MSRLPVTLKVHTGGSWPLCLLTKELEVRSCQVDLTYRPSTVTPKPATLLDALSDVVAAADLKLVPNVRAVNARAESLCCNDHLTKLQVIS